MVVKDVLQRYLLIIESYLAVTNVFIVVKT